MSNWYAIELLSAERHNFLLGDVGRARLVRAAFEQAPVGVTGRRPKVRVSRALALIVRTLRHAV